MIAIIKLDKMPGAARSLVRFFLPFLQEVVLCEKNTILHRERSSPRF